MIAAEKWHKYQADYQRYGFDMKPRPVPVAETAPVKKAKIGAADRLRILALIVLLGAFAIGAVIAVAYSAELQYNINQVQAQCDSLQREIQNLDVEIKGAAGIASVEAKAVGDLGMVYPTAGDVYYVDCGAQTAQPGTLAMKEAAYS